MNTAPRLALVQTDATERTLVQLLRWVAPEDRAELIRQIRSVAERANRQPLRLVVSE